MGMLDRLETLRIEVEYAQEDWPMIRQAVAAFMAATKSCRLAAAVDCPELREAALALAVKESDG